MKRFLALLICGVSLAGEPLLSIDKQPFLFSQSKGKRLAIPVSSKPFVDVPYRFSDGSIGSLSLVQSSETNLGVNPGETFQLLVRDSQGAVLGKADLVACYERFQLAQANIANGRGNEILFISQRFHGSSVYNPVMTILQLKESGFVEVGTIELASSVSSNTVWFDQALIDLSEKPASIQLTRNWASDSKDLSRFKAYQTRARCFNWSPSIGGYVESVP